MTKDEAILRYKTAAAVFKKWLAEGLITDGEFSAIHTMVAEKYGLSSCSIFLENDLLCKEIRANIP